jgi:uncharacterized protein
MGAPRPQPLADREIDALQALLDAVPAPLEPLDVVMLDGFLCGVLIQPQPVPPGRWWPHVVDADGRPLPRGFDAARLRALVERRHAELDRAIGQRAWFDPWVFELDDEPEADAAGIDDAAAEGAPGSTDAVFPWVAGFALALETFPALMRLPSDALNEPLALLYRHLAADDLEDADALRAEIDALEPVTDLAEAVEGLVRATLLLADLSRPVR